MSELIYTRQELKELILRLGIIDLSISSIHVRKKKISNEIEIAIINSTLACRNNIAERIYWIMNDILDYPTCQQPNLPHKAFHAVPHQS